GEPNLMLTRFARYNGSASCSSVAMRWRSLSTPQRFARGWSKAERDTTPRTAAGTTSVSRASRARSSTLRDHVASDASAATRVGESRMVRNDEERTSRGNTLAPLDHQPARRVVDDPSRAAGQPILAERAIVPDKASSDVIRDRSD